MSKKHDSIPQKNVPVPQAPPSGESPAVFDAEKQAKPSQSLFFNKTTLIGVGLLVIALVSVTLSHSLPYSLNWLSSSTSHEEAEPEGEQGEPVDEPSDESGDSFLASSPVLDYSANDADEEFADFTGYDSTDSGMFAGFHSFDPPGASSEWTNMIVPMEMESDEEEPIALYESDTTFDGPLLPENQPEPFLAQPTRVESTVSQVSVEIFGDDLDIDDYGDMDYGGFASTPTSHSPLPTSHFSPPTSRSITPLVDQSAINPRTFAETAAAPASQRTFRVANHDPSPDTVRPMDESDHEFLKSNLADTTPVVNANYAGQSFPEPAEYAPANLQSVEPQKTRASVLRREYRPRYAQARQGSRTLPNSHGQLWYEYDIAPFTKAAGIVPGSLPEQTLVKWILRQTGEEAWHSEPFGILSATTETLYVYHTPEMQELVAEIVDRFVNPKGETDAYLFRVVSLNSPNWLTQFHSNLKPIRIDTPGAQGWLIAKEDHARLIPELARRSDYKELCSPQFPIRSGRQYVISSSVPKDYTPNVLPKDDVWPGYVPETAVINEGYSMSLIPLSGIDGVAADLMVKCSSMQIEKMHSVALNVPSRVASRQRITVESPQVSHFQLDEQIRWPKDKVLVLSLGTIPVPSAAQFNDAGKLIPELSRKISGSPAARGHVLLFVECKTQ